MPTHLYAYMLNWLLTYVLLYILWCMIVIRMAIDDESWLLINGLYMCPFTVHYFGAMVCIYILILIIRLIHTKKLETIYTPITMNDILKSSLWCMPYMIGIMITIPLLGLLRLLPFDKIWLLILFTFPYKTIWGNMLLLTALVIISTMITLEIMYQLRKTPRAGACKRIY